MHSRSVLVVDDSPVDRLIIDNLLSGLGWSVNHAANGEDAINLMCRFEPDLVLMDIVMPGMGGIATIKKMRRILKKRWIPIVLVSGLSKDFDLMSGLLAGADDFIQKPIRPGFLRAKLQGIQDRLNNVDDVDNSRPVTQRTDIDFLIRCLIDDTFFENMTVSYQPIVKLDDGRVAMIEAVARWCSPSLGSISPSLFVPVVEQLGKSAQMTALIIREVLSLLRNLRQSGVTLRACVNLSPSDILSKNFDLNGILKAFENYQISPDTVTFEVSASTILSAGEQFEKNMIALHEAGFRTALDDVTAEHWSNADLQAFEYIKIDADSFNGGDIQDVFKRYHKLLTESRQADTLLLAEGVKTSEELFIVKAMGCVAVQGDVLQKALPAQELIQFMMSNHQQTHVSNTLAIRVGPGQ